MHHPRSTGTQPTQGCDRERGYTSKRPSFFHSLNYRIGVRRMRVSVNSTPDYSIAQKTTIRVVVCHDVITLIEIE